MRYSIKEPIPAIFQAWELLSKAADAHLGGDFASADSFFRGANMPEVWHWLNPAWSSVYQHRKHRSPDGDTKPLDASQRDFLRDPTREIKAKVLARDGFRCRYCGLPLVDAGIRKLVCRLYPGAVPWDSRDASKQHSAFQCLWLQYDHVVPHSHGGRSDEENIVASCALCNFGKDQFTLRQLELFDPRMRPPEPAPWDGLERLRKITVPNAKNPKISSCDVVTVTNDRGLPEPTAFFLPGAWVRQGYVYTPPIAGKERWFKLDLRVSAQEVSRNGIKGCLLLCDPMVLRRRGLSPDAFLDRSDLSRDS